MSDCRPDRPLLCRERSLDQVQVELERVQDQEDLLDARGRVSRLEPGKPGTRNVSRLRQLNLREAASLPLGADLSGERHVLFRS